MHKKLYRSRDHRVISGVMGGLGEYLNIDPVILRVILIVFVIATGVFPGIIGYIIAVFVIPEAPRITPSRPLDDDSTT